VSYGFGDLDKWISLVLTGLVLGIVNAFIRPIIELVAVPITCLTLGLFHFVISAAMLLLVSVVPGLGFQVDGFVAALLGAIVISIVGLVLSWILPD
jgi:putative membrane protein